MKKWYITFFLLAVIGVGAVAAVRYLLPLRQVSPLYLRYERMPGIAASYVHGFRINDTLRVDVTLLEATTDSGWAEIERAFAVAELPQHGPDSSRIRIHSAFCLRAHPDQRMDTERPDANELKCIDTEARVACLFHARNDKECEAVLLYKFNDYINQNNTTN